MNVSAIGARGFRRWYERQLAESFAYLTTGVLSLIMMAIAIEMLEFRSSAAGLLALVAIGAAGGALCVFAWRRFHQLLSRAEYLAEKAVCGKLPRLRQVHAGFVARGARRPRRLLARRALPRVRQRVDDQLVPVVRERSPKSPGGPPRRPRGAGRCRAGPAKIAH